MEAEQELTDRDLNEAIKNTDLLAKSLTMSAAGLRVFQRARRDIGRKEQQGAQIDAANEEKRKQTAGLDAVHNTKMADLERVLGEKQKAEQDKLDQLRGLVAVENESLRNSRAETKTEIAGLNGDLAKKRRETNDVIAILDHQREKAESATRVAEEGFKKVWTEHGMPVPPQTPGA